MSTQTTNNAAPTGTAAPELIGLVIPGEAAPPTERAGERLERLERENRNLVTRLERLEKQRGHWFGALLGHVLLLVLAGLAANYLGFLPPPVQRLPLAADRASVGELTVRGPDGKPRLRLHVEGGEVRQTVYDATGAVLRDEVLRPTK